MEPRISIITLGVNDLPRMVAFYRDGLGLTLFDDNTESIAFFRNKGTWLALYPRAALAEDAGVPTEGSGFSGVTLAHNLRSKAEVDDLLAVAVAAGATWSSRPRTPSGAATPATSPTRRATSGKSPGTPTSGLNNRI